MNRLWKTLSVSFMTVLTISLHTTAQNVEEGLKHLDAEQFVASGKIFRQLTTTAPTAENYFNLGYYYLNLPEPRLDSAKMAFEKGASSDPKKPDALNRVGLGAVMLGMKDRAGAKAIFDAVTKDTKSKNPDVLYRIGEAYTLFSETNDPAEAVKNLELALAKKKDAAVYIAMADAYLLKNDGGPAMTNLEYALPLAKSPAQQAKIKAKMGQVWVQGKNYKDALKFYNEAVAADPNYAPVYRQLGNFYVTYQNFPKAAENYKKYLELADSDCSAKVRYAKSAFVAKDYTNATKVLDEVRGCSKDPVIDRLQGFSQYEMGNPEAAIPLIQSWLSKADKSRTSGMDYGYLGRSYAAIKDPATKKLNDSLAILNMKTAIEMKDTSTNYYPDIAKVYMSNKNYREASNTYRTMIANNKKEVASDYTLLGQSLFNEGRATKDTIVLAESEKVWTKVSDIYKEKYPIAYYYVANSRRVIDGSVPTGKALPAMEEYIKTAWAEKDKPANKKTLVDACNYVGQVALLKGDNVRAAEYYEKTLAVDATNEDAIKGAALAKGVVAPTTPATPATPKK